jgi:1,2-dihydroxy-3-keto-5-methylthiopentene dioxygenase
MSHVPKLAYSYTASWFHWTVAGCVLGTVGTVLKAQQAPKQDKGTWMHRHKSFGLLTGMIVAPRLAYRLVSGSSAYRVQNVVGNAQWENMAGKFTHYLLYGFMTIMPASGIAMGYYGGKGLPFFGTTLSGVVSTDETKAANGAIAKQSFKLHKTIGTYGKFLIPAHVGAAFMHYFRGQAIFTRINPFRAPRG